MGMVRSITPLDLFFHWRQQLLERADSIPTSVLRRDWFLHMLQQTHDVHEASSVVEEFNQRQNLDSLPTLTLEL